MHDRPNAAELLDIVAEVLRVRIVPQLGGALAYEARIAANLVAIAAREIRAATSDDPIEHAALQKLLGSHGDLRSLNSKFAEQIAAGSITLETPGVLEALWNTTLAKLAVDQPKFPRLVEYP